MVYFQKYEKNREEKKPYLKKYKEGVFIDNQ